MSKLDERIIKFILGHHVLTLATSNENMPYCANCFYVFLEEESQLVFTSDKTTKHILDTENQNIVAGSIVLETNVIGKIQGIQFRGVISEATGDFFKKAQKHYLKRFPVAMLMKTTLWVVDLTFVKMTDNRLGFGKKIIWEKQRN